MNFSSVQQNMWPIKSIDYSSIQQIFIECQLKPDTRLVGRNKYTGEGYRADFCTHRA